MNPYATDPKEAISQLGETGLIHEIRSLLGDASPPAPVGIGDDCAVVQATGEQLITTDPVIYGKHFDDSLPPEFVAAKLAKRNLSDIAAMGGTPSHATVALALDPNVSKDWIRAFYKSLANQAKTYQFKIVGGDVSSADKFIGIFMTLVGNVPENHRVLPRHKAIPGSHIYVTGSLGGTRAKKHYAFTPRLTEGVWIARRGTCLSCTDLSDGLGKDYQNLLAPGTIIEIDCSLLPISDDAYTASKKSGKSPTYHVFNDGEDFELLFALAPDTYLPAFEADWAKKLDTKLTRIGHILTSYSEDASRLTLKNPPPDLDVTGYEHLR